METHKVRNVVCATCSSLVGRWRGSFMWCRSSSALWAKSSPFMKVCIVVALLWAIKHICRLMFKKLNPNWKNWSNPGIPLTANQSEGDIQVFILRLLALRVLRFILSESLFALWKRRNWQNEIKLATSTIWNTALKCENYWSRYSLHCWYNTGGENNSA